MSQKTVSLKIAKTCDGCGAEKIYETTNLQPDSPDFFEMQGWLKLIREVFNPEDGHFVKLMVDACQPACASLAAVKLFAQPEEQPTDDIDLAKLKVN